MIGKIKKLFFTGMFGILYISFVAQIAYALFGMDDIFFWQRISSSLICTCNIKNKTPNKKYWGFYLEKTQKESILDML